MKDNIKLATDFADKIKEVEGILQIVLFGSVASGEDTSASDIDIAVIHGAKDKFKIMEQVNKNKPEKIQTTFLDINDLYKETELVGALSGEGLLLYGRPIEIAEKKIRLNPSVLISYSLSSLAQTEKVKVNRALYGSTSRSKSKAKEYVTQTRGLIAEPGIQKINDGVLLTDRKKSFKIINLLKQFSVSYKEIAVWRY